MTRPVSKALLIAAAATLLIWWVLGTKQKDANAQAAIMGLYKSAEVGGSVDDLVSASAELRLEIRQSSFDGYDLLIVETPIKFGAQNWVMVVLGSLNTKEVGAYGIRTADGLHRKPEDAPNDIVSPAFAEIWQRQMTP